MGEPSKETAHRGSMTGHRMDPGMGPERRYLPMQPDAHGRFTSETTGLAFEVSSGGDLIYVFDLKTGERLLADAEQEEALKAANERAVRAEEELARLRAEIERLKHVHE